MEHQKILNLLNEARDAIFVTRKIVNNQSNASLKWEIRGPAPDPKCKLNISSFLTLPHLLDCLICTRNSVSIVLLL